MTTIVKVIAVALLVLGQYTYAHKQHVHQYIVKEAYELLQSSYGAIPQMNEHMGGLEPYYAGDQAWERPFVTTGAWREDDEDVIFGYRLSNLLNNYSLVGISHFWDADQGDFNQNLFRVNPLPYVVFDIGPYENAYDKFTRYANGGWILWFPDTSIVERVSDGHFLVLTSIALPPPAPSGIPLAYASLVDFFQSCVLTLRSDVEGSYAILDLNDQTLISHGTPAFDVRVDADVRDRIVWEVLGRMCHLLGDMSVPAHSRRDEHGLDPDSYENWVGGVDGPYRTWIHDSVGTFIDPFNADNDPLHYVMYTMQQQSNHFGSNGPYEGVGNDIVGGSPRPHESAFLTGLPLSLLGGPTGNGPWTDENLRTIMNTTLPYAIRATAGLLYWFAHETKLLPGVSVPAGSWTTPGDFRLEQNYPNPFNPSTTIKYELPRASQVSLAVYDLLGREVSVLVNERRDAGVREVKFDGSGLASGVYFYRLQAATFVETKKLLLIR